MAGYGKLRPHLVSCCAATYFRVELLADDRRYRYYALSQPFSSRLRRHGDSSPLIHQMNHLAADKTVSRGQFGGHRRPKRTLSLPVTSP